MSARGRTREVKPRQETDDEVRINIESIDPGLIPLFNRTRSLFKSTWHQSRTEAFLQYVREHPGEDVETIEQIAALKLQKDLESELDFYATPEWAITAILPQLGDLAGKYVIDAGCGTGAIGGVLADAGANVVAIEKDHRRAEEARRAGLHVLERDFLEWQCQVGAKPDLIISNPPYRNALEFVQHAISLSPIVCMLLRLPWIAGQKRAQWHRENPAFVCVLPRRPSFTGDNRTDATDYAWFVWGDDRAGQWMILNTTTRAQEVPF